MKRLVPYEKFEDKDDIVDEFFNDINARGAQITVCV